MTPELMAALVRTAGLAGVEIDSHTVPRGSVTVFAGS